MNCCLCVDKKIATGSPEKPAEAITVAPVPQVYSVGGNPSAAIVALPVCYDCRVEQLKPVSKSGLLTM